MGKKKQKFYVVWEGLDTGIYKTWDECLAKVKGYPNAKYKSFDTLAEAEDAFAQGYHFHTKAKRSDTATGNKEETRVIPNCLGATCGSQFLMPNSPPKLPALCVDAACSGNPGRMEYRGVWVNEDGSSYELFRKGAYEMGTNNVGEFLALVHGLAYLQKEDCPVHIYSDSRIAMGWVKQKLCKTKLKRTAKNAVLFEMVARAEAWLRSNKISRQILKWDTKSWGEIPADFGRK